MKKNYFSMIEILVGIVVLTIMMAFLINAFTTAEKIASTGNKSMDVFEKTSMALDFMSGELSHTLVNNSPRTTITMEHSSNSITFVCRLPFAAEALLRHKIVYTYDSTDGVLRRKVAQWDSTATPPAFGAYGTDEDIMKNIETFSIACYESDDTERTQSPNTHDTYPSYIEIKMKLQNPNTSSENVQRSFTRRVFFD